MLSDFYKFCKDLNLDIVGTMCIPPNNEKFRKLLFRNESNWP